MGYGDGTNNTKKGKLYVDLNKFDKTTNPSVRAHEYDITNISYITHKV